MSFNDSFARRRWWWVVMLPSYDLCCYGNTELFISDLILLVQLLFLMFPQSNLQPALESVWSSKQSKQAGLSGIVLLPKKDARKVDQTSLYFWSKTVFLLSSLLCLCPHNFWVCVCADCAIDFTPISMLCKRQQQQWKLKQHFDTDREKRSLDSRKRSADHLWLCAYLHSDRVSSQCTVFSGSNRTAMHCNYYCNSSRSSRVIHRNDMANAFRL